MLAPPLKMAQSAEEVLPAQVWAWVVLELVREWLVAAAELELPTHKLEALVLKELLEQALVVALAVLAALQLVQLWVAQVV